MDVTVDQLVQFSARRPMQYRVLMPAIFRGIIEVTPLRVDTINKLSTILSTFAILLLFARWLREYIPNNLAALAAPFILVPLFWNYCLLAFTHYPSDLPGIAFFLALLLLWKEKKFVAFYVVFLLACFNRETILFVLPCVAVLYFRKDRWQQLAVHSIAMVAIWFAVRAMLLYLFQHSDGPVAENHLAYNIRWITHSWSMGQGVFRYFVYLFGGLHILAFVLWKWTPTSLRTLLVVSFGFWAVMLPFGILLESRIFGELIPIYTASVIAAAMALLLPSKNVALAEAG